MATPALAGSEVVPTRRPLAPATIVALTCADTVSTALPCASTTATIGCGENGSPVTPATPARLMSMPTTAPAASVTVEVCGATELDGVKVSS